MVIRVDWGGVTPPVKVGGQTLSPAQHAIVYNWFAEPFADSEINCTFLFGDMHGLVFRRSIHYWQDQPGRPRAFVAYQLHNAVFGYSFKTYY